MRRIVSASTQPVASTKKRLPYSTFIPDAPPPTVRRVPPRSPASAAWPEAAGIAKTARKRTAAASPANRAVRLLGKELQDLFVVILPLSALCPWAGVRAGNVQPAGSAGSSAA